MGMRKQWMCNCSVIPAVVSGNPDLYMAIEIPAYFCGNDKIF